MVQQKSIIIQNYAAITETCAVSLHNLGVKL
jgi:hypothetical protein